MDSAERLTFLGRKMCAAQKAPEKLGDSIKKKIYDIVIVKNLVVPSYVKELLVMARRRCHLHNN